MANTVKTVLALKPEAVAVIDANATERKRGEFVSRVLLAYGQEKESAELGLLERIEARLARIEKMLREEQ